MSGVATSGSIGVIMPRIADIAVQACGPDLKQGRVGCSFNQIPEEGVPQ